MKIKKTLLIKQWNNQTKLCKNLQVKIIFKVQRNLMLKWKVCKINMYKLKHDTSIYVKYIYKSYILNKFTKILIHINLNIHVIENLSNN
jgi:glycine cleavage system regulatory protein